VIAKSAREFFNGETMNTRTLVCSVLAGALVACDAGMSGLPLEPTPTRASLSFSGDRTPWSAPVRLDAPVNLLTSNDQGPALSPDGLSLYFCSDRPPSAGNDLWVSERASEDMPWGEPMNLGSAVNAPGGDCGPALSEDGLLLFFTSSRAGGAGGNDIYVSARTDAADNLGWSAPMRLGPLVNTAAVEFSPFITKRADDGTAELYFERGDRVNQDIYMVVVDAAGMAVSEAVPVTEVNSPDNDGRPTVRWDGREMLLFSNREGRAGNADLFVSTRQSPNHPWSTPQPVDELNLATDHEIQPYLSRDGRTIYFTRGRLQANDIWVSTRTPAATP
jgi:Tol biopolymer transport system component